MSFARSKVLWFGTRPSNEVQTEHLNRGLTLDFQTALPSQTALRALFAISCAVVIAYDSKKKGISHGFARDLSSQSIDHGLKVIFLGSATEIEQLQIHAGSLPSSNTVSLSKPPNHLVAEAARSHDPGMPCNFDLILKGCPVSPDDELLLRRSFSDCKAVTLKSQSGGKSGARVFLVHAEPKDDADVSGNYTMPYFAKIDKLSKVVEEQKAFDRFASRYIPFNQRPNLESKRCVTGSMEGILVGDFVDGSRPLADILRPFGASKVIHSLFDDALACFRLQSFVSRRTVSASEFHQSIVQIDKIKEIHVKSARSHGRIFKPRVLLKSIEKCNFKYMEGPIHGDLNAENVFSRHNEAVLIDFCRTMAGPLASDLACLEVSIAFTGEANFVSKDWMPRDGSYTLSKDFAEWKENILSLFSIRPSSFGIVPPPPVLPCKYSWMWSSSRHLRLMAHYLDRDDRSYAFMLGLYLLRICMYDDDPRVGSPDRSMRGLAYYVGQGLILQSLKKR
jgi:hypothetical protein